MKFIAFALSALAFVAASPMPEGGPDPTKVYIESVTYGGSGCPQGSVGQSMSGDRTTFTLIFDKYIASSGPGVPIGDSRKNCQLNVNLRIPGGWAYTIGQLTYRGFVTLPRDVVAEQQSTYYFAGEVQQARFKSPFRGPITKDYVISDKLGLSSYVWSSCGAKVPVNINSEVRILNGAGKGPAMITNDSIDGKVYHVCGLTWRSC